MNCTFCFRRINTASEAKDTKDSMHEECKRWMTLRGVKAVAGRPCSICKSSEGIIVRCVGGHCRQAAHPYCAATDYASTLTVREDEVAGGAQVLYITCSNHALSLWDEKKKLPPVLSQPPLAEPAKNLISSPAPPPPDATQDVKTTEKEDKKEQETSCPVNVFLSSLQDISQGNGDASPVYCPDWPIRDPSPHRHRSLSRDRERYERSLYRSCDRSLSPPSRRSRSRSRSRPHKRNRSLTRSLSHDRRRSRSPVSSKEKPRYLRRRPTLWDVGPEEFAKRNGEKKVSPASTNTTTNTNTTNYCYYPVPIPVPVIPTSMTDFMYYYAGLWNVHASLQ